MRAAGSVPAVFYGPKEESTPIAVDAAEFAKVWKDAGETTIVTLTGAEKNKEVLIHDVATHPVSGKVLHIDFYAIDVTRKLEVAIPIEFTGTAPAEKLGGVVVKVLHELPIKVSAAELPQHFAVDLGTLEQIGDHIAVSHIALPASAELMIDPDETVVTIAEQEEEPAEEAAPAEGEAAAAPAAGDTAAQ